MNRAVVSVRALKSIEVRAFVARSRRVGVLAGASAAAGLATGTAAATQGGRRVGWIWWGRFFSTARDYHRSDQSDNFQVPGHVGTSFHLLKLSQSDIFFKCLLGVIKKPRLKIKVFLFLQKKKNFFY
ncbi:MAG: hypothetical protein A3B90_00700 [Candidatus Magasanikbacteria bacterium RIFCSPHIGHO2_02_FULL_41_13]|uniref:Uncharacterized protein n=1 Tax=Candidatus Magasanikbacteria bacterium RIFCSPHIGHO2_02_FULL_41_13 TaxID=1798676 RepID=A0A1F6M2V7_9BACT|nr:MAG: hypothetical protein A3B90_00700 [Candidatus Magasanikbacteria bacterium RIFCSPHIGHO2_02_FULL_41_13]